MLACVHSVVRACIPLCVRACGLHAVARCMQETLAWCIPVSRGACVRAFRSACVHACHLCMGVLHRTHGAQRMWLRGPLRTRSVGECVRTHL